MDYQDLLYAEQDGVATITINRPEVYNAFRAQTVEELIHAFQRAGWNPDIGVIVLTGAGDKAFSTGGDQKSHAGSYGGRGTIGLPVEELHTVIRDVPKPVIARVQGFAIGGGNVLAVLCDLTIASDKAQFGQVGPKVGSIDPGFGTAYLARIVGEKKAREIWYLCRRYSAEEAERMGLVNKVVPHDQLDAEVAAWCAEILAKSPTALAIAKRSFNADSEQIRGQAAMGLQALSLYYDTEESKEGVRAFNEKRPPEFRKYQKKMIVDAPDWFHEAVGTPAEPHWVQVSGCSIHYRRWGESGPPLLLVHGGGAHSHWWDFIAPWLATDHHVAAMDLSGMGESGRREQYLLDDFAAEAIGVCEDAGFGPDVTLVGHSLGGAVCLRTAANYAARVGGLVMADSPIRPPGFQFPGTARNPLRQPRRDYPDFESALARFRLIPEQPCENGYILDYIGRRSIIETPDGFFTWKFDDRGLAHIKVGEQAEELRAVRCRIGILYGEQSKLFPPEVRAYVHQLVDSRGPVAAIPQSHHHLFLDQPLAFVAALRTLLADWHSL